MRNIYPCYPKYEANVRGQQVKLLITGNVGTGKTFLFILLKNQVNRCYAKEVVKVGALTEVAARLVCSTVCLSCQSRKTAGFRLKQLKNNYEIFGCINIRTFADLMQLPPVRCYVFFLSTRAYVNGCTFVACIHILYFKKI